MSSHCDLTIIFISYKATNTIKATVDVKNLKNYENISNTKHCLRNAKILNFIEKHFLDRRFVMNTRLSKPTIFCRCFSVIMNEILLLVVLRNWLI